MVTDGKPIFCALCDLCGLCEKFSLNGRDLHFSSEGSHKAHKEHKGHKAFPVPGEIQPLNNPPIPALFRLPEARTIMNPKSKMQNKTGGTYEQIIA